VEALAITAILAKTPVRRPAAKIHAYNGGLMTVI
jgi:hypothetical protein